MKKTILSLLIAVGLIDGASAQQSSSTFGTGTHKFSLHFTAIGNEGNPADTSGFGSVPYNYQIGTYAISANQVNLATANGAIGLGNPWWPGDLPASNLSWYKAAAFVNWLNTSQGYAPAYNLTHSVSHGWSMALWPANQAWTNGGTNLYRNANCVYFLPTENEWYKAAYYDPNKINGSGGYWPYATGSTNLPTYVAKGTNSGTVVCNVGGHLNTVNPASVYEAGGLSPYGTMGQDGNIMQWTETSYEKWAYPYRILYPNDNRVIRGIWWSYQAFNFSHLGSSGRKIALPAASSFAWFDWGWEHMSTTFFNHVGFRVASVPMSIPPLNFTQPITPMAYSAGAQFPLSASSPSRGIITFSSSDPTVISISGHTATIHKVGGVTITASIAASMPYNTASVAVQVSVTPVTPTVYFIKPPINLPTYSRGTEFPLEVVSISGGATTFISSDPSIVEIIYNKSGLTPYHGKALKAGTVTITANVNATANYLSGSATRSVKIK